MIVGSQAKTEDKPPKKDLAKLGRRLSARLGAMISPKKEKKGTFQSLSNPLFSVLILWSLGIESEVLPVVAAQETAAATTESAESKVEEPVVETPSATTEETAIAPKIEEPTLPIAVEEPAKVEETKTEEVSLDFSFASLCQYERLTFSYAIVGRCPRRRTC